MLSDSEELVEDKTAMIDLTKKNLTTDDLISVAQQLMIEKHTVVYLRDNVITSQGVTILIDALLNSCTTLKHLNLSNNCISDLGVAFLARTFLLNNVTLKYLHLGSNCITDFGIEHLFEVLDKNTTLTDLLLNDNEITDKGVQHLTNLLKNEETQLKHLDIQLNKSISDSSVELFINIIPLNQLLEKVNLSRCNLTSRGKSKFLQAIVERKDFELII